MQWWKALGVAAFVGVAATGVAIARAERQRRTYTPEQVRDRLHARVAEVSRAGDEPPGDQRSGGSGGDGPSSGPGRAVRSGWARAGSRLGRLRPVATVGRLLRRVRGSGAGER